MVQVLVQKALADSRAQQTSSVGDSGEQVRHGACRKAGSLGRCLCSLSWGIRPSR